MQWIDTHQHLWVLRQFPYSWCAGLPKLNRNFLLDDYLAAAKDTGIEKTVFVECDVDEPHALDEARYIQSLAEKTPLIAGIIAGGRPEQNDFAGHLDQLLRLPKLRGLRRVLHVVPEAISQSALFVANIRRLAQHQLTFDICVLARQLPLAVALAAKCPQVQFILDHCGVPDVKGRAFDPWRGATQGTGRAAQCRLQNQRADRLRRRGRLDAGGFASLDGMDHRMLWLEPCGLGRRLAGLQPDREPRAMGSRDGEFVQFSDRNAAQATLLHQCRKALSCLAPKLHCKSGPVAAR